MRIQKRSLCPWFECEYPFVYAVVSQANHSMPLFIGTLRLPDVVDDSEVIVHDEFWLDSNWKSIKLTTYFRQMRPQFNLFCFLLFLASAEKTPAQDSRHIHQVIACLWNARSDLPSKPIGGDCGGDSHVAAQSRLLPFVDSDPLEFIFLTVDFNKALPKLMWFLSNLWCSQSN